MRTLTPAQAAVAIVGFLIALTHLRVRVPLAYGAAVTLPVPVLAAVALTAIAAAMIWGIWLVGRRCGFGVAVTTGAMA